MQMGENAVAIEYIISELSRGAPPALWFAG